MQSLHGVRGLSAAAITAATDVAATDAIATVTAVAATAIAIASTATAATSFAAAVAADAAAVPTTVGTAVVAATGPALVDSTAPRRREARGERTDMRPQQRAERMLGYFLPDLTRAICWRSDSPGQLDEPVSYYSDSPGQLDLGCPLRGRVVDVQPRARELTHERVGGKWQLHPCCL